MEDRQEVWTCRGAFSGTGYENRKMKIQINIKVQVKIQIILKHINNVIMEWVEMDSKNVLKTAAACKVQHAGQALNLEVYGEGFLCSIMDSWRHSQDWLGQRPTTDTAGK
jgi:hypothetical protein